MKRNLRFYFALLFARCTALAVRLIGRKGTSMPGSWAIILCPDFLGRMPKPEKILCITGTNGKTTVSNMVEDILEKSGYDFICNREGTNVHTGIASALIANSTFWGRPKKNLAVFEVDERSAPNIFPHIRPDILLCTNIFRDSSKRNAHVEFILSLLNGNIPDSTKLVLNGDDLLCSSIKPGNDRVFYGIRQLPGETAERKNIVCDVRVCPECGGELSWQFIRYHHIGQARCPHCGFQNPALDYALTKIDFDNREMTVQKDEQEQSYPLINENIINIYNALSAIALLSEFGLGPQTVSEKMSDLRVNKSRYDEETVGGKKIILHMAKGQNPIACSRAFENIRNYPGRKLAVLLLDDYYDAASSVENVSWFYDADFEFLHDDGIIQTVTVGARSQDVLVRLLLAGVPREKIVNDFSFGKCVDRLDTEDAETIFILYDVFTVNQADDIKKVIAEKLRRESASG